MGDTAGLDTYLRGQNHATSGKRIWHKWRSRPCT